MHLSADAAPPLGSLDRCILSERSALLDRSNEEFDDDDDDEEEEGQQQRKSNTAKEQEEEKGNRSRSRGEALRNEVAEADGWSDSRSGCCPSSFEESKGRRYQWRRPVAVCLALSGGFALSAGYTKATSSTSSTSSSMADAFGEVGSRGFIGLSAVTGETCRDTPDWTDGARHCAYEESGSNASLCKPSIGSLWPITDGWTCAAYVAKGWCSEGSVTASGAGGKGHPDINCCACGGGFRQQHSESNEASSSSSSSSSNSGFSISFSSSSASSSSSSSPSPSATGSDDEKDQCLKDTGGTCMFFGICDHSRGASKCHNGHCLCDDEHCADASGKCVKPPKAPKPSVSKAELDGRLHLEETLDGDLCQSTPDWTDGQSSCALDSEFGRNSSLCRPLPGASWPSTKGWTCRTYAERGWCLNGKPASDGVVGILRNYPEQHCCGCGGGRHFANPAATKQTAPATCAVATGGTCHFFRKCDSYRGAVICRSGLCLCPEGFCADAAGICQPRPSTTPPPIASSIRTALGLKVSSDGGVCQDTPSWTDGWGLCAYEENGRDAEYCPPTPAAFWPSTLGWSCKAYEEKGWCRDGKLLRNDFRGITRHSPESNCCVCGGGQAVVKGSNPTGATEVSNVQKQPCYADTGGTCHLFSSCAKFRGPTSCEGGHCLCKPGLCSDGAGVCRPNVGTVVARVAPVNWQHPQFPSSQASLFTALCISGGGSRSLAATMGYLRGLREQGLLENIDLISAVSGGSWAAALFFFAKMDLNVLLGQRQLGPELTMDALAQEPPPMGVVATTLMNDILLKLVTQGVPWHMLWVRAVAEAVLKPFGLDSLESYMAADRFQLGAILAKNPQLNASSFLLPHPDRPKALVFSGTVEAPDGYRAGNDNAVSLQMSPDFSGVPFVPNNRAVNYEPSPGAKGAPLHEIIVGGGMVETFAFGGPEPGEGQSGGRSVELQAPLMPLSLARAVGISSAAFAGAASRLGLPGVDTGAKLDPQANLWPVTSSEHPGPIPAMTFQLGDGSNLDNTGLIPALQRGARRITMLINANVAFRGDRGFCGSSPTRPDPRGTITTNILDKFGWESPSDGIGFYEHNTVFEKDAIFPLLCDFTRLQDHGLPLVSKQRLTVQTNERWGLRGDFDVEVLFVMLAESQAFLNTLPDETQAELAKGQAGPFGGFPNFKTIFQNSDLTALSRVQVNLLAAFADYTVKSSAELFDSMLQR